MNVKLAVVLLFGLVAYSQAGFVIYTSYSDSECNSTNIIASFATNDAAACSQTKRSIEQSPLECKPEKAPYHYTVDYSFCNNDTVPTFPASWQTLLLSTESSCNAASTEATTSFISAPMNFGPALIAVFIGGSYTAANTTLNCDTTTGNLTASAWVVFGTDLYLSFNLEQNVCTLDQTTSFYAKQSTCAAPPVAVPEAPVAPVAPMAAPMSTPTTTTTPVKTPGTKTSSASIVYGSTAALLSLAALL